MSPRRRLLGWSPSAVSRRTFLRGLGGVTVALPLLSGGLFGRPALGEEGQRGAAGLDGFPKRFIFMIHPNGVIQDDFWPTSTGPDGAYQLSKVLSPLAPFQEKLTFLKGINLDVASAGPGEPHQTGMGCFLTGMPLQEGNFRGNDGTLAGWGGGISLDQSIAGHIGRANPFKSLELGVRADVQIGSDVSSRISYASPATPLPPQNDPVRVFESLFKNAGGGGSSAVVQRDKRLSVLDTVQDQFRSLEQRVSRRDRERLDQHFAMVRDLETRLKNEMIDGQTCTAPPQPPRQEVDDEETMESIAQLQIDMMVVALACDLTRVATLQLSNSRNHVRYPWVDSMGDGHGLSHAGPSNANARKEWNARDTWHAGLMAYLCQRLDAIPEGGGTMLDNTVILWTSEISQGNTHSQKNMPIVMAGSAGGALETGQFLHLPDTSHNDLLTTLAQAFGLEIASFGDARFNKGDISAIVKT